MVIEIPRYSKHCMLKIEEGMLGKINSKCSKSMIIAVAIFFPYHIVTLKFQYHPALGATFMDVFNLP